jgi:hypothetical protein
MSDDEMIWARGWYNYYSIFETHFLVFKEFFSENYVLINGYNVNKYKEIIGIL